MAVKIVDKIVQMNGQNYPLMDASAVEYEDANGNTTNVKDYLDNMSNMGGGISNIALSQPISVDIETGNAHVKLKWTDPDDVIVGSTTLATWKKTVIVRKEGSAPSSETDGTIVVESTTRNEYSETPYIDDGLVNGTKYYYGIFPCTTENVYTTTYSVSAMPLDELKIVTFADGTDAEIIRMIEGHYNDEINIADYWSIGDMRTIHIDATDATGIAGLDDSYDAQDQKFVIIGIDHDDLETEINGHTKAAITIQPLEPLYDKNRIYGHMNTANTNSGGWEECPRRTWCNNVFYNALPLSYQNIIKPIIKLNYKVYNSDTLSTTIDKVFLLSETEVFGKNKFSVGDTEGIQYEYYKTSSNSKKYVRNGTYPVCWAERTPMNNSNTSFCAVWTDGTASGYRSNDNFTFAPAICL